MKTLSTKEITTIKGGVTGQSSSGSGIETIVFNRVYSFIEEKLQHFVEEKQLPTCS